MIWDFNRFIIPYTPIFFQDATKTEVICQLRSIDPLMSISLPTARIRMRSVGMWAFAAELIIKKTKWHLSPITLGQLHQ